MQLNTLIEVKYMLAKIYKYLLTKNKYSLKLGKERQTFFQISLFLLCKKEELINSKKDMLLFSYSVVIKFVHLS